MKPVVCFYKDNQFIYSENYILLSANKNVFEFLADIEKKYSAAIKIVQVDFEATFICVFILNTFKIINPDYLNTTEKVDLEFKPRISKNYFIEKVIQIKKDISDGRYYQVNLTSKFLSTSDEDSFSVFKKYFGLFKSRYSAFLPIQIHQKNYEILCYSPELFLEKIESKIKTEPIKGTLNTDMNELITSPKEIAELSMIVDLLRNDLNSVCDKPVRVSRHREVLDLEYTQHTYSEISGETQMTLPEILKNVFPGGSISGCPKLESLKAISEIETGPRGFYTGSIGWWHNSDFKLNIAIRSFKKQDTQIEYFAGCGIVFDSDPESEWHEFLTKAGRLNIRL
jgi:para-aminobenzoate synthetase component I